MQAYLECFYKYSIDFLFPYDMLSPQSSFNKQWSKSSIDFIGLSRYLKLNFVALDRFIKEPQAFDLATKFSTLDFKYDFLHNNIKLLDFYNYVKFLTHRWKFLWITLHIQRKLQIIFYLKTHVPNTSLFSVDNLFLKQTYMIKVDLNDQTRRQFWPTRKLRQVFFSFYPYLF